MADSSVLDYETNPSFTLTVTATDSTLSDTADIIVNLTNVNDNLVVGLTDDNGAANTVAEDVAIGTAVGVTALASDADAGATISYSLTDNAGGRFSIDSTTGVVKVASALDYETNTSHSITVLATSADGSSNSNTFSIAVTDVVEAIAPTITTPGILYWSIANTGDMTPINRISFQDADSLGTVRVTLATADLADDFDATSSGGVTVALVDSSGSDTDRQNVVHLDGTIADINAFLFAGNVHWNPNGSNATGTLTVTIDDNGTVSGGNVVTASVSIAEITSPTFNNNGLTYDFSGVNLNDIATQPALSGGSDTITTSWSHGSTVTYDGGTNSGTTDTITLVFTPDQLAEILADGTMQGALRGFLDGSPGALNLSASSWNGIVQYFEVAHIDLATGYGVGTFNIDSVMMPVPTADTTPDANTDGDLVIGSGGIDALTGGAGAGVPPLNGNDVLVGLGGNDSLSGGSGADLLLAGDGDDTLTGGTGNDVLSGGRGADTFVFNAGDNTSGNADTIVDYSFVEGDKLDLSGLLDAAFGPSSTVSDFVQLTTSGSNVVVQVDTDGTGVGAGWTDVATLANYSMANADLIKVYFESADHLLTV